MTSDDKFRTDDKLKPNQLSDKFSDKNGSQTPDSKRYSMSVVMTGIEYNAENNYTAMANGVLTLKNPQGQIVFQESFLSGGNGKYGDNSMLPGLDDEDGTVTGERPRYKIMPQLITNSKSLSDAQKIDGTGFSIRLVSDRSYTQRGLAENEMGRTGALAIHLDGAVRGSIGCIVFEKKEGLQLRDIMSSIPVNLWPSFLGVDKPQIEIKPIPLSSGLAAGTYVLKNGQTYIVADINYPVEGVKNEFLPDVNNDGQYTFMDGYKSEKFSVTRHPDGTSTINRGYPFNKNMFGAFDEKGQLIPTTGTDIFELLKNSQNLESFTPASLIPVTQQTAPIAPVFKLQ
ncbi:MAG: hypothetical protein ACT4OY_07695 [Alphaproteobacteria bacterium]